MKIEKIVEFVRDPNEKKWEQKLEKWFVAEKAFIQYFENIEEEGALPDLYGKLYKKIQTISEFLGCEPPECFVYESYSYTCDSEGLKYPRLEVSARMLRDFDDEELTHILAKEIYHIAAGHLRLEVMSEKILNLIKNISSLPGINLVKKLSGGTATEAAALAFRNIAFRWFKYACFSADNFATAYTGNIQASVKAILLSIFNERDLVNSIDLREYIHQVESIEHLLGPFATLSKVDEVLPYGPYRVLNILRYFISDRGREFTALCSLARKGREG